MKRVLIITNHYTNRSPGQRFRFEQYLDFLNEKGFKCDVSNFITPRTDNYFSKSGNYLQKIWIIFYALLIRFWNVWNIKRYDLVFIFREALPIGSTLIERLLAKNKAKIIFDFDDAIWLQNVSTANRHLAFLKDAKKTEQIISLSNIIFAGNNYLATHAKKFNSNVVVIPTTIDTSDHHNQVKTHKTKKKITIGWTGTHSTLKYLKLLNEVTPILIKNYDINFLIICDKKPTLNWKNQHFVKWSKTTEIEDLLKIDIGVMPLYPTEWAKGKCGFKILQYLALGIPAVASPVGVNSKILQHGVNGFLAETVEEWIEYLSKLIESTTLRSEMGKVGRQTVIDKYSVEANKELYLKYFNEVLEI